MIASTSVLGSCRIHVIDLITTHDDQKFAPAGHMASEIINITEEKGECCAQDLMIKGFAAEEVAQYWHMAQSLASVEIKLMGTKTNNIKSLLRRT